MLSPEDAELFADAFDSHMAGCRDQCNCGRVFWDSSDNGWDWADGEVESLQNDPGATAVHGSVRRLILEGRMYMRACGCWHERAGLIVQWLRNHQRPIGEFFKLEKERLRRAAEDVPTIEDAA